MSAPKLALSAKLHFHIRWSRATVLDWQVFKTHEEAEVEAKQVARENETYTIEGRLWNCERCKQVIGRVMQQIGCPLD